jgi:2-dehydro-3-deoxyphosphooctonate aldolase (KDO 8-P synthase)
MHLNQIPQIKHIESGNFFVLAGPCAIEGEEMAMRIAEHLVKVSDQLEIPLVFNNTDHSSNLATIAAFSSSER